jgi:hypothetical protein
MLLMLGASTRPTQTSSLNSRPMSDHGQILPTACQTAAAFVGSIGQFSSGMNPAADARIRLAEMGLAGVDGGAWITRPAGFSGLVGDPANRLVKVHEKDMSRRKQR